MPSESLRSREDEWVAIQDRLREILSRHGRNSPQGDYLLTAEDTGSYEQKILVFFRDAVSSELVEEIENLLWPYSREWQVLMVAAKSDGTEMAPRTGLKVSAVGLEVLPPTEISPEEDRDTRELYVSLERLLGAHGTSNAFGHGDYWIVDDSWVPRSHKVCIFKIQFLTPQLADEVQKLLKEAFPACQVWFQIEVVEPGVPIPLPGIRVFADRIEQDWDRDKMMSLFNGRFLW